MMNFFLVGLIIHLGGLAGNGEAGGRIKSFQSASSMNPVTPFQNGRIASHRHTRSSHAHRAPLLTCDKSVAGADSCGYCVATKCTEIIPVDYRRARCGLAYRCYTEVCPAECNADRCNCCETAGPICSASNCGNCANICDICQRSCPSSCPGDSCEFCTTLPCSALCHTSAGAPR